MNKIKKQTIDNTEMTRKKILEFIDANSIFYKYIKKCISKI